MAEYQEAGEEMTRNEIFVLTLPSDVDADSPEIFSQVLSALDGADLLIEFPASKGSVDSAPSLAVAMRGAKAALKRRRLLLLAVPRPALREKMLTSRVYLVAPTFDTVEDALEAHRTGSMARAVGEPTGWYRMAERWEIAWQLVEQYGADAPEHAERGVGQRATAYGSADAFAAEKEKIVDATLQLLREKPATPLERDAPLLRGAPKPVEL